MKAAYPFGVCAALLCSAARLVFAADPCAAAAAVTCAAYPDADTVVIDDRTEVEYRADGTYVDRREEWVKAMTEKGRRELSSLTIDYSLRYGRGEIVSVEIVGVDGRSRPVDFRATLKEATDNSSGAANIYDPLDKTLSCAVPGLAVGEIRHVVTRREVTKSRVKDQWAGIEVLAYDAPILRASVRIAGPLERPLKRIAVRHPLGNVVSEVRTNGSEIVYSWCATNSPQAFPEPNMPPLWTQVQHLRVSTADSWPEISRWYWSLCQPHLARTNAAMTNKVEELGRDLRRIYDFVAQEVRYMGLTMEDTSPGYAPHDVDVTFDNRYGVCRDKAGLLVALLRLAGHDAYPVLINAGPAKMDAEVPLPYFNHAIVAVRREGAFMLMDPTDESSRDLLPSYLSDCSYLVATPEGEQLRTSPVVPPAENAVRIDGRGTLSRDGSVLAEYAVAFGGLNDNAYRHGLLRMKPLDRRKFFERVLRGVKAGAELLKCDIAPADLRDTSAPLSVSLAARFPECVLEGRTRDELALPSLSSALGVANWLLEGRTALERRVYPLVLSSTAMTEERFELDLSAAQSRPQGLPAPLEIKTGCAFDRRFTETNGTLLARRTFAIGQVEFSPAEYHDLRETLKRIEADERQNPTLSRDDDANANVRIRRLREVIDLDGPDCWRTVRTVEKEVLTYDGKKRAAELKFDFNPTWEAVELVSGVVSNRDGRVSAVGAREQNVLDCGWASKAPRYPASKELVVNLPSVEVGSVISTTVAATVTNAPASFYRSWFLDTREPVDELELVVNGETLFKGAPKRLPPDEPLQAAGRLWREWRAVSSNDFARAAARLLDATDVEPVVFAEAGETLADIRNWMARQVRIVGPSLYELPLPRQVTDSATVLRERYATRLDYMRTLCALLRGAGYEADVVFAADDADEDERLGRWDRETVPNVRRFSSALCRVRERIGGFLWWGGEERTTFLGTENEYTPLGATAFAGAHFLDPRTGGFGTVTVPAPELLPSAHNEFDFAVRLDGSVDVDCRFDLFGPGVGAYRRKYEEMLPEERQRHHQKLLAALAHAADATSELKTDTVGYPARTTFSAFVPKYVTLADGVMTLEVPAFDETLFALTGTRRESPLGIDAQEPSETVVRIVFPLGYGRVEHLPSDYVIHHPRNPDEVWFAFTARTEWKDGRLAVELRRRSCRHGEAVLDASYFALLKDWNRMGSSRANRTVSVALGTDSPAP